MDKQRKVFGIADNRPVPGSAEDIVQRQRQARAVKQEEEILKVAEDFPALGRILEHVKRKEQ